MLCWFFNRQSTSNVPLTPSPLKKTWINPCAEVRPKRPTNFDQSAASYQALMLSREQKYGDACLYFGFKHFAFLHDVSMLMSENLLLQVLSARLDARDVRFIKGTQIFS